MGIHQAACHSADFCRNLKSYPYINLVSDCRHKWRLLQVEIVTTTAWEKDGPFLLRPTRVKDRVGDIYWTSMNSKQLNEEGKTGNIRWLPQHQPHCPTPLSCCYVCAPYRAAYSYSRANPLLMQALRDRNKLGFKISNFKRLAFHNWRIAAGSPSRNSAQSIHVFGKG